MTTDPDRYRRWFAEEQAAGGLFAAATVVVLRDSSAGPEVLLMRRSSEIAFGGLWVFPGGRIDPEDFPPEDPDDVFRASSTAAVREAKEEADLDLDIDSLVRFSHWTPPRAAPKRFATWFFLAPAPAGSGGAVTIDDGEITDHDWMTPSEALERRDRLEIEIVPPTFVTLVDLVGHDSVASLLAHAGARETSFYVTKLLRGDAGPVALWRGDAAFDSDDLDASGPRHRLLMGSARWELQRDD